MTVKNWTDGLNGGNEPRTIPNIKFQIPNSLATPDLAKLDKSQITALRDPATIKINIRSGTNSKFKILNKL